jgi:hypothetical protein
MKAILSVGLTSIHNLPLNTNQRHTQFPDNLISLTHFYHRTRLCVALLVVPSTHFVLNTPFYILVHIFSVYIYSHRRWRFYG